MSMDVEVRKTRKKGKGVFAARDFIRGEFITFLHGQSIKKRTEYSVQVSARKHINPDARKSGVFRFANHSCNPNSGIGVSQGKIGLRAIRNIRKGEEITWDYAMSEYEFNYFMPCHCGSKNCRKLIGPYLFLDKKTMRRYKNFIMPYLKKMPIKNVAVMMAGKKGLGVFACHDFRKGEVVLRYQKSRIFRSDEVPKVWKGKFCYLDRVGKDRYMIMKPPERFINCSCSPNVFVRNWKIIAMKPIKKGEEITYDCAINNAYDVKLKCFCGSKNCRGIYPRSFFRLDKKLQRKYLPYLDTWFRKLYRKKLAKLAKSKFTL